jgi:hypothetical protein
MQNRKERTNDCGGILSFPDKYFAESWLVSKASNPSTNESTVINTTQENNSTAIATSVRPTLTTMNKNEIDRGLLNELLQSVVITCTNHTSTSQHLSISVYFQYIFEIMATCFPEFCCSV